MRKFIKMLTGLSVAGLAGYVVVTEGVAVVSSDAVVNARVAVVRAPIDGLLAWQSRSIGERVQNGQALGSLNDARADDARLLDLERAASALEFEINRLQTAIASIDRVRISLHERSETYRDGRVRQLQSRIEEQEALLASARAQAVESNAALQRADKLRSQGVQSVAMFDRALAMDEVNALNIRAAIARIDALRTELDGASKGMFLGDSYNDTPYTNQRAQELEQRLIELNADLHERTQRLAKTNEQVAVERQRVARLRDAFLTSPVDGLVWEVPLGNGEYARKGQDLLRILDCATVIVTASVSESDYNRLKVGDPAQFRLSGTDRTFSGQVLRLAGSGAITVYNNLAIAPGPDHLKRFDVALAVPDLRKDAEAGCSVGRTGKVVFSGTPRDLLRSVKTWLGFI